MSHYAEKDRHLVIGLMSGTSADGVDAALVEIAGETIRLLGFHHSAYQPEVRRRIFELFQPEATAAEACRMSFLLGELFAEAALSAARAAQVGIEQVDLVASHGQTICHLPPGEDGSQAASLQIGEPAVIAERTGVTTVADFRPGDLAAGGQGAPLVPFADYLLFRHPEQSRAVQNIGGIANVTLLPAGCSCQQVIAFDTGPGNMVVDALVEAITEGKRQFDEDGEIAASGHPDPRLLDWMMSHPFVEKPPPKSTGREEFGAHFTGQLLKRAESWGIAAEDLVASATAFTARSIGENYQKFLFPRARPDQVVLGGGGSYNPTLRRMIQQELGGIPLLLHEDFGILGQAKEAMAFALLGHQTMLGRPSNLPSATGASHPVVLGKIVVGKGS